MSDSPHLVGALDYLESEVTSAHELTARIILLYDRLAKLDRDAAEDLARSLPQGWHGLHIIH
jgi:hypothetical protein